ncbi:hypothetical protein BD309DRAFT_956272 [Dichomitus squalens]|uniref:Uncharacterized protein n=1 Tax=Dichomitus squalens TaxID=114155 RepID=A0A4Q9N1M1_9APHY|nr:hypothetical protein BD311DRAFT_683175 [Dichomitus squalens]TBU45398.1 hypothetical protein BD309DRAFT_956272 [Dichomitus squalens]
MCNHIVERVWKAALDSPYLASRRPYRGGWAKVLGHWHVKLLLSLRSLDPSDPCYLLFCPSLWLMCPAVLEASSQAPVFDPSSF